MRYGRAIKELYRFFLSFFCYLTPVTSNRYKLDEAIRVQLRESAKIRKRESLQMDEATLVPDWF